MQHDKVGYVCRLSHISGTFSTWYFEAAWISLASGASVMKPMIEGPTEVARASFVIRFSFDRSITFRKCIIKNATVSRFSSGN